MKEKHIYLILSIILLLVSFFTTSDILYADTPLNYYIQKSFIVPIVYFFLIAISGKLREMNIWAAMAPPLFVGLLFMGTDVIAGKSDIIIIPLIIASAIVAVCLRLIVRSFVKK